jgi:hypothetical protein
MSAIALSKAYKLATQIKELAPWKYMDESDIFGVSIPDSGKKYFVSIMGSGGEHFGMSAYEDLEGLAGFWNMHHAAQWMRPLELLLIPHLMVSFENREVIIPAVRQKMNELGFVFRGQNAWPDFRQITPGFAPYMPTDEALEHLIIVMEQAINVFERAKSNPYFIFPEHIDEDAYLVRVLTKNDSGSDQWEDTYQMVELPVLHIEPEFSAAELDIIPSLPKSNDILQADIAILGNQIAEPGARAYFPSVFMLMSKKFGTALHFEMLTPLNGINAMRARFPDLIIKALLKLKYQPAAIEIRHPVLFQLAKQVLQPTNLKLHRKDVLNQVEIFLESFEKNFH